MNNVESIRRHLQDMFPACHISIESRGWPYEVSAIVLDVEPTKTGNDFMHRIETLCAIFGAEVLLEERPSSPDRNDSMGRTEPGSPAELVIRAQGYTL